jgi:uncharacterized protein (DUF2062 family)
MRLKCMYVCSIVCSIVSSIVYSIAKYSMCVNKKQKIGYKYCSM